jgi:hypothetical protein
MMMVVVLMIAHELADDHRTTGISGTQVESCAGAQWCRHKPGRNDTAAYDIAKQRKYAKHIAVMARCSIS